MRTKRKLFLILFLALNISAEGQDTLPLNATWNDSARIFIKQLKDGALLVRLHSRSQAIAQLKELGNFNQANDIAQQQREENLKILQAFRTSFTFCRVYFFFGDSTDAVLKGKRSGFFLNDSLIIDPSITQKENFFMIAEEGNPHVQTKYDKTQPNNELKEPSYVNEAIVIYDRDFRALKDPFPYYAHEPFPFNLTTTNWNRKVEVLNGKLNSFYEKSQK